MTTLFTPPGGLGRHRQTGPRVEESVPHPVSAPAPAKAPVPAPVRQPLPAAVSAPAPAPVPARVPALLPSDPPLYRAVLSLWASQGRTLPGHHDQERTRSAPGPVRSDRTVRVDGTLARPGDGR
ncbi:hypothetical protein ACIQHY_31375 [Streptomyces sp. NPDC092359]|uniref:hypothetical protein n=1 Tax=Streptomyces sp. NPDC092359 TaxID=3366014 RepID=UPI0037F3C7D0